MSSLIPEKRVDKNGRIVTKHVRHEKTGNKTSSLPAPALSEAQENRPSKAPRAKTIIKHLNERGTEIYGDGYRAKEYRYEAPHIDKNFSPELRQQLNDLISTAGNHEFGMAEEIVSRNYDQPNKFAVIINTMGMVKEVNKWSARAVESMTVQDIEKIYSDLNLREYRGEMDEYYYSVVKAEHLAQHLDIHEDAYPVKHQYYRQIEILRNNLEELEPAVPVLMAKKNLTDYGAVDTDEVLETARFANERQEHIERIADLIEERQEFDPEFIDAVLNSNATAISEGML